MFHGLLSGFVVDNDCCRVRPVFTATQQMRDTYTRNQVTTLAIREWGTDKFCHFLGMMFLLLGLLLESRAAQLNKCAAIIKHIIYLITF